MVGSIYVARNRPREFFSGPRSYERNGAEDASLQKLLGLQHWPGRRLGSCTAPRLDNPGRGGRAIRPVDFFRLRYRLGVHDDCSLRLSATKALAGKRSIARRRTQGDVPTHVPNMEGKRKVLA